MRKFLYLIILIIFIAIISISYSNYTSTIDLIEERYENEHTLIKENILQSIEHLNDAYLIAEDHLEFEMKEYSERMVEIYAENPDVMSWDLESMQDEFAGYEIFIINKDLVVINTTYEDDLGLDFSVFPNFANVLQGRLNGNDIFIDRLGLSVNTGEVNKFSYMPTPDNEFLLQLSVQIEEKYQVFNKLDIFEHTLDMTGNFETIDEVVFYKLNPDGEISGKISGEGNYDLETMMTDIEEEHVLAAYNSGDSEQIGDLREDDFHQSFIPALVTEGKELEDYWNSYVVGITFDNTQMNQEIDWHLILFLINTFILLVVFIIITLFVYRRYSSLSDHRNDLLEELEETNRNLEKKVEERTKSLIEAQDSRKKMLANIAHDLGGPIAGIKANLQLFSYEDISVEKRETYNRLIEKSNYMRRLIEDLFDLSKLESHDQTFDWEKVKVGPWITELFDYYNHELQSRGMTSKTDDIEASLNEEELYVNIDRQRILQVMENFIDNAVKFSENEGDRITLKAFRHFSIDESDQLVIEVSDDGMGMSEEAQSQVFKRFYSKTGSHVNGSGLGLAIAQEIVQQHYGQVGVRSQEGVGSTFYFTVPIKNPQ